MAGAGDEVPEMERKTPPRKEEEAGTGAGREPRLGVGLLVGCGEGAGAVVCSPSNWNEVGSWVKLSAVGEGDGSESESGSISNFEAGATECPSVVKGAEDPC